MENGAQAAILHTFGCEDASWKASIPLYCNSKSQEIAAWLGHFDGSGHKSAGLCICKVQPGLYIPTTPCTLPKQPLSSGWEYNKRRKKKKERKNIFSSLSNLHDAEAEVKLKASCLELSHAKIAFFGENSLATDCFAVRDINPCRVIIVLSLCSTAPLFFPSVYISWFFFMCVTKG